MEFPDQRLLGPNVLSIVLEAVQEPSDDLVHGRRAESDDFLPFAEFVNLSSTPLRGRRIIGPFA
jgi:hypothetical protein